MSEEAGVLLKNVLDAVDAVRKQIEEDGLYFGCFLMYDEGYTVCHSQSPVCVACRQLRRV